MDLTNEIVEKNGFKRVNNSTWRNGNITLQNGYTNKGNTIYEKILSTKKAYKVCIDSEYIQMVTSEECLIELVRWQRIDSGVSNCHIPLDNTFDNAIKQGQ